MKAYELLEQKGWCQNAIAQDKNGNECAPTLQSHSLCAYGAIIAVNSSANMSLLYDSIKGNSIGSWNDDPSRTKEEVIAKLKELDL